MKPFALTGNTEFYILDGVPFAKYLGYYFVPRIHPTCELPVAFEQVLEVIKKYNLPTLMYGSFNSTPFANASAEYHLIELEDFPNITPLTKNRRKEYKKAFDIYIQSGLYIKPVTREQYFALPLLAAYADSSNTHNALYAQGFPYEPIGYYDKENNLVAVGLLYGIYPTALDEGTCLYSATIQIMDKQFHCKELTIALAQYAKDSGCTHLDLWNVAATPREDYKRIFFTKETRLPCFTHNFEQPWINLCTD